MGGWAAVMIDDRAGIGNHLLYNHHPPGGYEPFTRVRAAVMIALLSGADPNTYCKCYLPNPSLCEEG